MHIMGITIGFNAELFTPSRDLDRINRSEQLTPDESTEARSSKKHENAEFRQDCEEKEGSIRAHFVRKFSLE